MSWNIFGDPFLKITDLATFCATLNDWKQTVKTITMTRFSICSTISTISTDHLTDQCFRLEVDSAWAG